MMKPQIIEIHKTQLADYYNIHTREIIIVCGCGSSLNEFKNPDDFITIGVNDVGRMFTPTYLVVVNYRQQFKNGRFKYVQESRAQAIFTQLDLKLDHPNVVHFKLGRRGGTDFSNPNMLHYTQNSPYVALCLAVHMGAKRIGLIGIDFTDHHFFANTGPHNLTGSLQQINQEYTALNKVLLRRSIEVVNFSQQSLLTAFPKVDFNLFLNKYSHIKLNGIKISNQKLGKGAVAVTNIKFKQRGNK